LELYKFTYKTIQDIQRRLNELNLSLSLTEHTASLLKPMRIGETSLDNRMGIAPMEGFDSNPDGSPGELARRRYINYARGGAGLIWFESVTVVPEGRSCARQLSLTKETLPEFQRLIHEVKETGIRENGYAPYLIMQANHSGRYSRPNQLKPEPIIAFNNPHIEGDHPLDSSRIADDDYLESLEEKFGEASKLCREAGFDAIDIKSCHGYLLGELAGAFTRKGKYGGSLENRFRLLLNAVQSARRAESADFKIVVRLNIFDGFPYPYGYGVKQDGGLIPDYSEPIEVVRLLHDKLGIPLINISMGDPHIIPYITRPFQNDDKFSQQEDPLAGVARMYEGSAAIKRAFPDLLVSSSAPSYMRRFAPNLAAGAIDAKVCDHVCFGRLAFANANFPRDIKKYGMLELKKSCLACSKCSSLGRAGMPAGCVVRDTEVYLPYYKELTGKSG